MYVFTDGGCHNNGRVGATGAYAVFFAENSPLNCSKVIQGQKPTNQLAELLGIQLALSIIHNAGKMGGSVVVCTDSMYSINCIEVWSVGWAKNDWKNAKRQSVKHQSVIRDILRLKQLLTDTDVAVTFRHVLSHTKEPYDKSSLGWKMWFGNKRVDEMIGEILR